jgi:hypothetical protein
MPKKGTDKGTRRKSASDKKGKSKNNDVTNLLADSFAASSKLWDESFSQVYKPWMESAERLTERAVELSKDATPEKYKEFYDEWMKAPRETVGKLLPQMNYDSPEEMLRKALDSAEEFSEVLQSLATELNDNAAKTSKILANSPDGSDLFRERDPQEYRENYEMWMKTYEKVFDELVSMPTKESTKELLESYGGASSVYLVYLTQIAKLWKDAFSKLQNPWADSTMKIYEKAHNISKGEAGPEAYKEFYDIWKSAYQESYGQFLEEDSMMPSKELIETFIERTDAYLSMYKAWISALEKMSVKVRGLSQNAADPEAVREFYGLWTKTYEKAFGEFFEHMPMMGPMDKMMEPIKNSAKMYADTLASMADTWTKLWPSERA